MTYRELRKLITNWCRKTGISLPAEDLHLLLLDLFDAVQQALDDQRADLKPINDSWEDF